MLGDRKKMKQKEQSKKKTIHNYLIIGRCFFAFMCFTCMLVYGLNLGSIIIMLLGIASIPIKPINNLWDKVLKEKSTPAIKVIIVVLCFLFSLGLLPETEPENSELSNTQNTIENVTSEIELQNAENSTEKEYLIQVEEESGSETDSENQTASTTPTKLPDKAETVANNIPGYSGKAYVVLNGNIPNFNTQNLAAVSYEYYSNLDNIGRCGVVHACIGKDLMPTEERGSIGHIKPTGWHTVKYNGVVDGNYLYNRCHLIGFQLTGENDNEKNLITGTRQFNVEGMLPFENMVADYIKETNNHVMYRVTPVFEGNNLLATGVQMEAYSVEDNGQGICFNVFIYNVQDKISIDYSSGKSFLIETSASESETPVQPAPTPDLEESEEQDNFSLGGLYAVNGKNGKIHKVGECTATGNGSQAMTDAVYFDTYDEALAYSKQIAPNLEKRDCGNCW